MIPISTAAAAAAAAAATALLSPPLQPRILLLKRSSHVVTCPNTWSLLGEHQKYHESLEELVFRAVYEELGLPSTSRTTINSFLAFYTDLTEYPKLRSFLRGSNRQSIYLLVVHGIGFLQCSNYGSSTTKRRQIKQFTFEQAEEQEETPILQKETPKYLES